MVRPLEKGDNAGLTYMKKTRKKRVIVLEDLDFVWDQPDLRQLAQMWMDNANVAEMAEHFERDPDEILLALIHLARNEKISKRERGILHGFI